MKKIAKATKSPVVAATKKTAPQFGKKSGESKGLVVGDDSGKGDWVQVNLDAQVSQEVTVSGVIREAPTRKNDLMNNNVVTCILIVMTGCFCGCSSMAKKKQEFESSESVETQEHLGHGAVLPADEVARLTNIALEGNGEAAYRLAAHFGIGVGDAIKAREFRRIAINADYPPALYAEAVRIWEQTGDKTEARRLLDRAMSLGYADSANLAEDLK